MEKVRTEKAPDNPKPENPGSSASYFMENDYMNEWLSFFDLIHDEPKRPAVPKGFSERYPGNKFGKDSLPFSISDDERRKIKKLDELAEKAKRLILIDKADSDLNRKALIKLAIQAARICKNVDWAEGFERKLNE